MTTRKVQREYPYTQSDFEFIKKLVYKVSGINLSDAKSDMVYSRLARRVRALKLTDVKSYCNYLESHEGELVHTINAITTNLTHFFREKHHFDLLKERIIPEIVKNQPRGKKLRIWSAGCSTGEEPYSIAMTLRDALPNYSQWDCKISASDLDTNVIETCIAGIYNEKRIEPIEQRNAKRWFKPHPTLTKCMMIDDELKKDIAFKQLNLMNNWPIQGPFDVIFCRNVVIYFDKPTQQKLFARFYDLLTPGGYLFLGHSEQLGQSQSNFEVLGKTSFKKA
ncbi:MAG: chemotaxis protein methyltransferase CheR [Enterobacterales bacterium]